MKSPFRTLALVAAAALAAAPLLAGKGDPPAADGGDLTLEAVGASVAGALDTSADPCADFYRYACGGWLDSTELPADQPIWGRSFSVIHEGNRELLRTLIESAAADPGDDPDRKRVGDYYASCMDEAAVEKAGLAPLAPWLARIDVAADRAALFTLAGELRTLDAAPFYDVDIDGDFKDPSTVVAHFAQGGLGLPERDYYLSDDETKKGLRDAYKAHVAKMLVLVGTDEKAAATQADALLAFETSLAEASRPAEKMRVFDELHHRLDIGGLAELAPDLPWKSHVAAEGRPDLTAINVMTPEFFEALDKAVAAADLDTLRAYLRYDLVTAVATLLPDAVYQEHFDFYGRTLSGQQEPQARWKRCIAGTGGAMGQPVGRLYVAERFTGASKQVAEAMIGEITDAFAANLPNLAWMDEETRQAAIVKKDALAFKIGYPDRWRDYSKLAVSRDDYFASATAARAFENRYQIERVGRPYDRSEWTMDPQVVNAGYNPLRNDHTYPAGILQPPFFHKDFPAAMNYGGIGYVMGHELTHGFDDQGRKFDATGKLSDWWSEASVTRFEERAACVEKQYSAYEIEPGVHVNGALTLGENIADIGGLKQAWDAYRKWKAAQPGEVPGLAGLTSDQLFWVNAAQVWCTEVSPELNRMLVQTDPHSPSRFRVLGTLSDQPAFAATFGCKEDAPMNPAAKCEVW